MGQLIIIVVIIRVSFACNGCENDGCRLGDLCVGLGHDGLPGGTWGPRSIGIISTSLKNEASILLLPSPPIFSLKKTKEKKTVSLLSPYHTIFFLRVC